MIQLISTEYYCENEDDLKKLAEENFITKIRICIEKPEFKYVVECIECIKE